MKSSWKRKKKKHSGFGWKKLLQKQCSPSLKKQCVFLESREWARWKRESLAAEQQAVCAQ